ncbi:transcriptional regulator [Amycolatopsis orientalis]|uniref:Transcriptional regulator WhiB n=1 Tax=Amycolatopsis orientalis TaxID=31958 RepID=A0A193BVM8_AMYOR|nr:WhiB family transcriptional regulator [Amycolatopsis orientalis]ANN16286.1 transcriptional regulator [Amycolatopsis orientalis]
MEMRMAGDLTEAACRGEDPELFFPVTETGPGARQVARAKAVCARCPVTSACLAFALDNGLAHGVFGGLTDSERRRPIRVRSAA